jgi:hypothetical protein
MVFLAKVKKKISPHNNVSRKGHEPMTRKMRQDCAEAGQQLFVKNPMPITYRAEFAEGTEKRICACLKVNMKL